MSLRNLLIILILTACSVVVFSQDRPRIGLTLSGGGAKGFAHVGVLKVLEREGIPIDYITGTSMGAIVGGLYAMGYSPEQLEEIISTADWDNLLGGGIERRELSMELKRYDSRYMLSLPVEKRKVKLPSGLISDHRVFNLLSRLTVPVHAVYDFEDLSIPFACIGTDIITGEAVVLDKGSLAEAMRASMSLPSIFPPIEVQDHLLVDGGIVRNFPVSDIRDMGADLVIGVDVSAPLKDREELTTFIDVLDQSSSFRGASSNEEERKLVDILIKPDISGISLASFGEAKKIVLRGEQAADKITDQLQALADSAGTKDYSGVRMPAVPDSFHITEVELEGLKNLRSTVVFSQLQLIIPANYALDDLDDAMERLYSIQSFQHVVYSLIPNGPDYKLIIHLKEKSEDLFRLSLRYNSNNNATLLLNTFIRNIGQHSSFLNLDARLGTDVALDAQYFYHTGWLKSIGLLGRVNYSNSRQSLFDDESRRAEVELAKIFAELDIGSIFSTRSVFTLGFRLEHTSIKERVASTEDSLRYRDTALPLTNLFWWDTMDKRYFTTSGLFFMMRNDFTYKKIISPNTFSRNYFHISGFIPVAQRFTINLQSSVAFKFGDDLPPNYRYVVGGIHTPVMVNAGEQTILSFHGTKYQELSGEYIQFLLGAVQFEMTPSIYLTLTGNIGNTFEEWNSDFSLNRYKKGIGLMLGADTPLGPAQINVMTGTGNSFLTYINLGFVF